MKCFQNNCMFCFIMCKADVLPGLLYPAFLIITMTCLVSRQSDAVYVLQLLMFGPNQYFAENALLGDYTYRASAVAEGRVTVLRTSCEDFNMVCNLAPQHGQTFLA